jgi:hypothetical protein
MATHPVICPVHRCPLGLADALEGLGAVCSPCREACGRRVVGALGIIAGAGERCERLDADGQDRFQKALGKILEERRAVRGDLGPEVRERRAWAYLTNTWRRLRFDEWRHRRRWRMVPAEDAPEPAARSLAEDPRMVEVVEQYMRAFDALASGPRDAVLAIAPAGQVGFRQACARRTARLLAEMRGEPAVDGSGESEARAERRAAEHLSAVYDDPADADGVAQAIHRLAPYLSDLRTWSAA